MAVIRDMMPAFELFQPATIDEAVKLLEKSGRAMCRNMALPRPGIAGAIL